MFFRLAQADDVQICAALRVSHMHHDAAEEAKRVDALLAVSLAPSYTGVRDLWERASAMAGVLDAHLHDLRAKSLTDAKRQGLDAQHLAGHTTEAMTARYLRGRERDAVVVPSFGRDDADLAQKDDTYLNG